MTDDELADLFYKVEHEAGDTRAARRALYDAGCNAPQAAGLPTNADDEAIVGALMAKRSSGLKVTRMVSRERVLDEAIEELADQFANVADDGSGKKFCDGERHALAVAIENLKALKRTETTREEG